MSLSSSATEPGGPDLPLSHGIVEEIMAKKTHKDVEFAVGRDHYDSFAEAALTAVTRSIVKGGERVHIDVLVSSRAGAKWFAGDDGVEMYKDDPEASVFDRIEVRADSKGRVP